MTLVNCNWSKGQEKTPVVLVSWMEVMGKATEKRDHLWMADIWLFRAGKSLREKLGKNKQLLLLAATVARRQNHLLGTGVRLWVCGEQRKFPELCRAEERQMSCQGWIWMFWDNRGCHLFFPGNTVSGLGVRALHIPGLGISSGLRFSWGLLNWYGTHWAF